MAEKTLGGLQKQVEQLSKQVIRLQDNIEYQKHEKEKKQFGDYKKSVNQAVDKVTEHYENLIRINA